MSGSTGNRPSVRGSVRAGTARRQGSFLPVALAAAGAVVIAAVVFALVAGRGGAPGRADEDESAGEAIAPKAVVTFAAVGDNLPDEHIAAYADTLVGEPADETFDYSPIFAPLAPFTRAVDLAYIDQETHLGGNDLGARGYPSFNTTDEMADAVVDAGFDFVASATNHSYDWGLYGAIDHSLSVWETKPVAFTGTAVTAEQYNRIATVERNGITFALLNYTYGVNGFDRDELPEYAVNFIDEGRIAADVARAREAADVVMVAMHWGTENLTEADDEQVRLAQFLADLNVDVVLGSHPHVIGPVAWVDNSDGSGHRTLVAYSLGNFLADHETPGAINVLEGMLYCNFVREAGADDVEVRDVKWIPLVCHSDDARSTFAVYPVATYPADLARANRVFHGVEDPIAWLNDTTASIVSAEFL